jgi:hypothetical protein
LIDPKLEKGGDKNKPKETVTAEQARKTALVVSAVLVLFALWNVYRVRFTVAVVLAGIAVLLTFIGLFIPVAAKAFHRFWMAVAGVLGYVNSRILLTILYYGLLTPYGFFSRLFGRDPLVRRGPNRDTYWVKREKTRQTQQQFERLF